MTGRVYPSRAGALGVSLLANHGTATFESVTYWDNMLNVWPNKTRNASSPLESDGYYQTHVPFENECIPVGTELYNRY